MSPGGLSREWALFFYEHLSLFEGRCSGGVHFLYEHSSLFEGSGGGEGGFIYLYEHLSLFEGRCGGDTFISTNIHPSSREGVVGKHLFLRTFIPL